MKSPDCIAFTGQDYSQRVARSIASVNIAFFAVTSILRIPRGEAEDYLAD
jgi:hypothetical protein